MEIKIRNLKKDDVEKLREYINEIIDEDGYLQINKRVSLKEEEEFVKRVLKEGKKDKMFFLMAEINGKLIGACEVMKETGNFSHRAKIGITVSKDHRGKGIGSRLLKKAIEKAGNKWKDLEIIELGVAVKNKNAIKVYEKSGFEKVGDLPDYFKINGKYINAYLMYKRLNQ